ncbi:MAG: hypothetical protein U0840_01930 [Gemmataceae bacterium]
MWILVQVCLFVALGTLVGWVMWREDFDGMRSSWEYHRRCRSREALDGATFFARYYAESGLPREVVVDFRDFHATYWGEDPARLRPEDDLLRVNSGADCTDWVQTMGQRYGLALPEPLPRDLTAVLPVTEPTFDALVRCLHGLGAKVTPGGDQTPDGTSLFPGARGQPGAG